MDITEAYRMRGERLRAWAKEVTAEDVANDYVLLRSLAHTSLSHGILKNALRKDKREALRLWYEGIDHFHRIMAGDRPSLNALFGLNGEFLSALDLMRDGCGLIPMRYEDPGQDIVKCTRDSYQDWKSDLGSQTGDDFLNPYNVVLRYGALLREELEWQVLSELEDDHNLETRYKLTSYKLTFKREIGDWLLFPSVHFFAPMQENGQEAHFCNVGVRFLALRKDEIPPRTQLPQFVADQSEKSFPFHQFLGLAWGGWRFERTSHMDAANESYFELMRIFNAAFDRTLQGLGLAD